MDTKDLIGNRLLEIEQEHSITIMYACESGSRAWGFASPDSDFDIRFVYKRQLTDYLVLRDHPDTLEFPIADNLDFGGWDLKKFLNHVGKSNCVMFEWLQSPIVYCNRSGFQQKYRTVIDNCFEPRATLNHYLGLTKRTLLEFGDAQEVNIKKYFYILRPVLAALWIHEKNAIPPMEFGSLLSGLRIPDKVLSAIAALRKSKQSAVESEMIRRNGPIEDFVNSVVRSCEQNLPVSTRDPDKINTLNALFQQEIQGGD